MLLPFRLRRFISRKFIDYSFVPIAGYNCNKHLPVRCGRKRFLIEKESLRIKNNTPVTFVIISDADYFILAQEQIRSIFIVEPQSEVFLFDAGLRDEQKQILKNEFQERIHLGLFDVEGIMTKHRLLRSEAMFFFKIHAVTIAQQKTSNTILIYSDAANVFLKPLNELKNFVQANGFYGGMTTTHLYCAIQQHEVPRECAKTMNLNLYDKRFVLIEGGLWAVDTSHNWIKTFLQEYLRLTNDYRGLFILFPHDMIAMSLLIYKHFVNRKLILQETPNIRFNVILEQSTITEKNMTVFDYNTEKIPFFGYAVHNCSNHPEAPEKRRCSIYKDDILSYINIE